MEYYLLVHKKANSRIERERERERESCYLVVWTGQESLLPT
jgi:hypothetical protein